MRFAAVQERNFRRRKAGMASSSRARLDATRSDEMQRWCETPLATGLARVTRPTFAQRHTRGHVPRCKQRRRVPPVASGQSAFDTSELITRPCETCRDHRRRSFERSGEDPERAHGSARDRLAGDASRCCKPRSKATVKTCKVCRAVDERSSWVSEWIPEFGAGWQR